MPRRRATALLLAALPLFACTSAEPPAPASGGVIHDVILRGGTIYDGTGGAPYTADVGIDGDRIAGIGDPPRRARPRRDRRRRARGRARLHQHALLGRRVAARRRPFALRHPPGRDPRGVRRRHVDGSAQRRRCGSGSRATRPRLRYEIPWQPSASTCDISRRRASRPMSRRSSARPRCACTRSATKLARPTPEELDRMTRPGRSRDARRGDGRRIVAPLRPGDLRLDAELTALPRSPRAEFDGMYITHIRDEGDRLLESIDEFLRHRARSGVRGEVYHLKASNGENWDRAEPRSRRSRRRAPPGCRSPPTCTRTRRARPA